MRLRIWIALCLAVGLMADESKPKKSAAKRSELRVTAPEAEPPLEREGFRATVDGKEAKVLRVKGPGDDLMLLLVLDLSGEPTLIDTARQTLVEQLGQLPENHWVGVLKAQDTLKVLADPSSDRDIARAAIEEYPAAGKAGLLNTVEEVLQMGDRMAERSGVRVAVIYITDSNVYNYREDYTNPVINRSDQRDLSRKFPDELIREQIQKLSARLARLETPFYVVQLNFLPDAINESYRRGLIQLAAESGGAGGFCRSRAEITSEIARIWQGAIQHWNVAIEYKSTGSRTVNVDLFHGERDIPNRTRFAFGK